MGVISLSLASTRYSNSPSTQVSSSNVAENVSGSIGLTRSTSSSGPLPPLASEGAATTTAAAIKSRARARRIQGPPGETADVNASSLRSGELMANVGSGELRDHVLAEQLDRLHHLLVRDVVRVDQAQQHVAPHGLVPLGRRDAGLGVAHDRAPG